jgi:hypothetical protein
MKRLFPAFVFQLLLLLCFTKAWSQTTYIEYTYDNAGNRIKRYVVVLQQKTDSTKTAKKDSVLATKDSLTKNDSISKQSVATGNNNALFTEQVGEIKVSVFPNPTRGALTLKVSCVEELKAAKIYIYTESGVLLEQKEINSTEQVVDFTSYSVGNYFLKVMFKNMNKTFKIVKTY